MPIPHIYSFPRYLAAKKSVDDRSLNRPVWETVRASLRPAADSLPLQVLEIGAGIGTMLERMLEQGMLAFAHYTAIDSLAENIHTAHQRLAGWGQENGYQVETTPSGLVLARDGQRVTVDLLAVDLFDFIAQQPHITYDLLVAHAFLDLMDIPDTLPKILSLLKKGGRFYFSINFDGVTLFQPVFDAALDEHIQALYHRSMDERTTAGRISGDSRAGRHLFTHLNQAGATILAAGASDWVVFPRDGIYPADEAYFLHFIIHTIQHALQDHPQLAPAALAEWTARRHLQVERGELVYIAHQLDFAGKVG